MHDRPAYRWSARDLIEAGLCTPQCLLAAEDGLGWTDCQCRCNGVLHGALAREIITREHLVEWFADAAAASGKPDPMAAYIEGGGDPRLMTEWERAVADLEDLAQALRDTNQDASWLDPMLANARRKAELSYPPEIMNAKDPGGCW